MSSLDYFNRGITKAFERRAKQRVEQAKQKTLQIAQKVDGDAIVITTVTNNTDKLSADEKQYQATIVQRMVALIKQRKMK